MTFYSIPWAVQQPFSYLVGSSDFIRAHRQCSTISPPNSNLSSQDSEASPVPYLSSECNRFWQSVRVQKWNCRGDHTTNHPCYLDRSRSRRSNCPRWRESMYADSQFEPNLINSRRCQLKRCPAIAKVAAVEDAPIEPSFEDEYSLDSSTFYHDDQSAWISNSKTETWLNSSSCSSSHNASDQVSPTQQSTQLPNAPRLENVSPEPPISPASSLSSTSTSSYKSSAYSSTSTTITTPSSVASISEHIRLTNAPGEAVRHNRQSSNSWNVQVHSQVLHPGQDERTGEQNPDNKNNRSNPRRSSIAHSWSKPSLIRQNERRQGFVEYLVDAATQLVSEIWPRSKVSQISKEYGVYPLRFFIREVLRRSRASYSTLQVALYYLVKIQRAGRLPQCDFTQEQDEDSSSFRALQCGRRMFLAGLILASKYLQDRNFSAKAWSKISGLGLHEISVNEMAFLEAIHWNLHVKHDEFQNWTTMIVACTEAAQKGEQCPWAEIISGSYEARKIPGDDNFSPLISSNPYNARTSRTVVLPGDGQTIRSELEDFSTLCLGDRSVQASPMSLHSTNPPPAHLVTPQVTPWLRNSSLEMSVAHPCQDNGEAYKRPGLPRRDSGSLFSVVSSSEPAPSSLITPVQTPALEPNKYSSAHMTTSQSLASGSGASQNSLPTPAASQKEMLIGSANSQMRKSDGKMQTLDRTKWGFDESLPVALGTTFRPTSSANSAQNSPQDRCSTTGETEQHDIVASRYAIEKAPLEVLDDPVPAKQITLPCREVLKHRETGPSNELPFSYSTVDDNKKRRRASTYKEHSQTKARRI